MSAVLEFRPGFLSQQEAAFRSARCTQKSLEDLEVQLMQFRLQRHQRALKSNGVRPIALITLLLLLGTTIAGGAFLMCSRVSARNINTCLSLDPSHEIESCAESVLKYTPPAGSISTAAAKQHALCFKPASVNR